MCVCGGGGGEVGARGVYVAHGLIITDASHC